MSSIENTSGKAKFHYVLRVSALADIKTIETWAESL